MIFYKFCDFHSFQLLRIFGNFMNLPHKKEPGFSWLFFYAAKRKKRGENELTALLPVEKSWRRNPANSGGKGTFPCFFASVSLGSLYHNPIVFPERNWFFRSCF